MLHLDKGVQGLDDYIADIVPDQWKGYAKLHRQAADLHRTRGSDLMADVNILIATRLEEMLAKEATNPVADPDIEEVVDPEIAQLEADTADMTAEEYGAYRALGLFCEGKNHMESDGITFFYGGNPLGHILHVSVKPEGDRLVAKFQFGARFNTHAEVVEHLQQAYKHLDIEQAGEE